MFLTTLLLFKKWLKGLLGATKDVVQCWEESISPCSIYKAQNIQHSWPAYWNTTNHCSHNHSLLKDLGLLFHITSTHPQCRLWLLAWIVRLFYRWAGCFSYCFDQNFCYCIFHLRFTIQNLHDHLSYIALGLKSRRYKTTGKDLHYYYDHDLSQMQVDHPQHQHLKAHPEFHSNHCWPPNMHSGTLMLEVYHISTQCINHWQLWASFSWCCQKECQCCSEYFVIHCCTHVTHLFSPSHNIASILLFTHCINCRKRKVLQAILLNVSQCLDHILMLSNLLCLILHLKLSIQLNPVCLNFLFMSLNGM